MTIELTPTRDERYSKLVRLLVDRRNELGITQAALAKRLEIYQQFIGRYELNDRRLDVVEFVDVARALGLDPIKLVRLAGV